MNNFNKEEIEKIIKLSKTETCKELYSVIYSLARDIENEEEFEYAYRELLRILEMDKRDVNSFVITAISMLALSEWKYKLDEYEIENIIKKESSICDFENKSKIEEAVEDLNHLMNWNIEV